MRKMTVETAAMKKKISVWLTLIRAAIDTSALLDYRNDQIVVDQKETFGQSTDV